MIAHLSSHVDRAGVGHRDGGSVWLFVSMMAFSLFLLAFAWALVRSTRRASRSAGPAAPTPADIAAGRFARGEIDADQFESIVDGTDTRWG